MVDTSIKGLFYVPCHVLLIFIWECFIHDYWYMHNVSVMPINLNTPLNTYRNSKRLVSKLCQCAIVMIPLVKIDHIYQSLLNE